MLLTTPDVPLNLQRGLLYKTRYGSGHPKVAMGSLLHRAAAASAGAPARNPNASARSS